MQLDDQRFSGADIVIDGNTYSACTFERCRMIYRGGEVPRINNCELQDCSWHFEGAADRTLSLLRNLYHGLGTGGAELVEGTIESIRKPIEA